MLDACPQLVPLFAHQPSLGACGRELVSEPLDLSGELTHPRVGSSGGGPDLGEVETQALDCDLQLATLGEQLLDERLSRLCRLFRHIDTGQAGTREAEGVPSRRAETAL